MYSYELKLYSGIKTTNYNQRQTLKLQNWGIGFSSAIPLADNTLRFGQFRSHRNTSYQVSSSKIEEVRRDADKKITKAEDLKRHARSYDNTVERLESEIGEYEIDIEMLETELQNHTSVIGKLEKEIEEHQKRIRDYRTTITSESASKSKDIDDGNYWSFYNYRKAAGYYDCARKHTETITRYEARITTQQTEEYRKRQDLRTEKDRRRKKEDTIAAYKSRIERNLREIDIARNSAEDIYKQIQEIEREAKYLNDYADLLERQASEDSDTFIPQRPRPAATMPVRSEDPHIKKLERSFTEPGSAPYKPSSAHPFPYDWQDNPLNARFDEMNLEEDSDTSNNELPLPGSSKTSARIDNDPLINSLKKSFTKPPMSTNDAKIKHSSYSEEPDSYDDSKEGNTSKFSTHPQSSFGRERERSQTDPGVTSNQYHNHRKSHSTRHPLFTTAEPGSSKLKNDSDSGGLDSGAFERKTERFNSQPAETSPQTSQQSKPRIVDLGGGLKELRSMPTKEFLRGYGKEASPDIPTMESLREEDEDVTVPPKTTETVAEAPGTNKKIVDLGGGIKELKRKPTSEFLAGYGKAASPTSLNAVEEDDARSEQTVIVDGDGKIKKRHSRKGSMQISEPAKQTAKGSKVSHTTTRRKNIDSSSTKASNDTPKPPVTESKTEVASNPKRDEIIEHMREAKTYRYEYKFEHKGRKLKEPLKTSVLIEAIENGDFDLAIIILKRSPTYNFTKEYIDKSGKKKVITLSEVMDLKRIQEKLEIDPVGCEFKALFEQQKITAKKKEAERNQKIKQVREETTQAASQAKNTAEVAIQDLKRPIFEFPPDFPGACVVTEEDSLKRTMMTELLEKGADAENIKKRYRQLQLDKYHADRVDQTNPYAVAMQTKKNQLLNESKQILDDITTKYENFRLPAEVMAKLYTAEQKKLDGKIAAAKYSLEEYKAGQTNYLNWPINFEYQQYFGRPNYQFWIFDLKQRMSYGAGEFLSDELKRIEQKDIPDPLAWGIVDMNLKLRKEILEKRL